MMNIFDELQEKFRKELNYTWLLTAYRHGNLFNTLSTMKKEDVSMMFQQLDYGIAQMGERNHQQPIKDFDKIQKELLDIKEVFMNNLNSRVEKDVNR